MDEKDDELDATPADQDRAAILARRQRFIVFALSGLATTACTDGNKPGDGRSSDTKTRAAPDACLKVSVEDDEDGEQDPPPQPCLSIAPPDPPPEPPSEPRPNVCLKIAAPEPEPDDTATPEPAPRPCLSKPRPCLRKAPPPQPPAPDE